MNNRLATILATLMFSSAIHIGRDCGAASESDCLWVEFGERIRERDGSLTQLLHIGYGGFPSRRKGLAELRELRAFYRLKGESTDGEIRYREVEVERNGGAGLIKITTYKTSAYAVLVRGKVRQDGRQNVLLASASLVLFPRSFSEGPGAGDAPAEEVEQRFRISVTPEFSYWPQTGEAVDLLLSFDREAVAGKMVRVFDESGVTAKFQTDATGHLTYVPPEDEKLNHQGVAAFKQTVVVSEMKGERTIHLSSHTFLFHRSRFGNRRLLPGMGIFMGTLAGAIALIIWRRRSFAP